MTRKLPVLIVFILALAFSMAGSVSAIATTSTAVETATAPTASTALMAPETTRAIQRTATDAATKLKQQTLLLQEQKKVAITAAREKEETIIKAKRDEFKAKLQTIKDEKKKVLVEKIDARLAEINKNQTTRDLEVIVRLQKFLDKAKLTLANTAKAVADITAAQTAIDSAKAAVEAQAGKTYIMVITDDLTLKQNAGTVVSQLRQDLVAIYKVILDAKQAVQKLNTEKEAVKKEASKSAEI